MIFLLKKIIATILQDKRESLCKFVCKIYSGLVKLLNWQICKVLF